MLMTPPTVHALNCLVLAQQIFTNKGSHPQVKKLILKGKGV